MSTYTSWLKDIEPLVGGFSHKNVLDVGCDWQAEMVQLLVSDFGAGEAIGINLIAPDREFSPRVKTMRADVKKLPFRDNYFDVILSSSAFEHIRELDIALAELFRVLKKGGHLYTHFGPIWSTCYGHHLWVGHEGREYTYHNVLLPPWCHLLMERSELQKKIEDNAPQLPIQKILDWVYHSDEQNRLFFEDYEKIFEESPFRRLFVKGYDYAGFVSEKYRPWMDEKIFDRLRSRYPRNGNWNYDGITALLRKD